MCHTRTAVIDKIGSYGEKKRRLEMSGKLNGRFCQAFLFILLGRTLVNHVDDRGYFANLAFVPCAGIVILSSHAHCNTISTMWADDLDY